MYEIYVQTTYKYTQCLNVYFIQYLYITCLDTKFTYMLIIDLLYYIPFKS